MQGKAHINIMKKEKLKVPDLTVTQAYILYRFRSNPELWRLLDDHLRNTDTDNIKKFDDEPSKDSEIISSQDTSSRL